MKSKEAESSWSLLHQFIQFEKTDLRLIIFLTFGAGLLSLTTPLVVQTLVNVVNMGGATQPLFVVSIILFALLSLSTSIYLLEYYIVELIQRRIFVNQSINIAKIAQSMCVSVRETENPSELMNRFFDVVTMQKTTYQLLTKGLAAALQAIIGSIVLIFYSPYFAAIVFFLILMVWFIVAVLGGSGAQTAIAESYAKYNTAAWLENIVARTALFKFAGAKQRTLAQTDALANDYLDKRKIHFAMLFKQNALAGFLYAFIGTAMLGLGGWLVMQGNINLGQFVAAELIIFGVLAAFTNFVSKLEYFYDLLAAFDKFAKLNNLPTDTEKGELLNLQSSPKYQLDQLLIEAGSQTPIQANLAASELSALLVNTDCNKAKLGHILAGLAKPAAGTLSVNDIDLRLINTVALRDQMALLNSVEITEGTLLENLTIHQPNADIAQVQTVLNTFEISKKIAALPNGLNTALSPNGAPLTSSLLISLVLVRAVLANPKLLIIESLFDRLHDDFAAKLIVALKKLPNKPTLILITENAHLAQLCDSVIKVHDAN